jgi:glycosyltransferase involved in cell wall biosynthesis
MGVKLSALIQVYNEELFVGPCLAGLLPVVDEIVIVHGGPDGISTDKTALYLESAVANYPGKIVCLEGVFRQKDGQWDHTRQNNLGLECVTGDFVIRTHADLIYDISDVAKIKEAVNRFPDKKYFYSPMLDFYGDTDHILLPAYIEAEKQLGRPQCGDPVAFSMKANPRYIDYSYGVGWVKSGLQLDINWGEDILFLPHVNRYHYAFARPFEYQVSKMMRNLMRGQYEALGEQLKTGGRDAMYQWIIDVVLGYGNNPARKPYAGSYPAVAESLRGISYLDGYEDFMQSYNEACL